MTQALMKKLNEICKDKELTSKYTFEILMFEALNLTSLRLRNQQIKVISSIRRKFRVTSNYSSFSRIMMIEFDANEMQIQMWHATFSFMWTKILKEALLETNWMSHLQAQIKDTFLLSTQTWIKREGKSVPGSSWWVEFEREIRSTVWCNQLLLQTSIWKYHHLQTRITLKDTLFIRKLCLLLTIIRHSEKLHWNQSQLCKLTFNS